MSDKLFSDKIMAMWAIMDLSCQDQKWLRHILDSKTNSEYYFKHVQFHFSDRVLIFLCKQQIMSLLLFFSIDYKLFCQKNETEHVWSNIRYLFYCPKCVGATFDLDRKVHYGSHCHNFVRNLHPIFTNEGSKVFLDWALSNG
jgi:hypothetical protein